MRYIIAIVLAIAVCPAMCQVTGTEYFIDTDPGYSKATAVSVSAGTDITAIFTVPLSLQTNGFHTVGARARDAQGHWSLTYLHSFFVLTAAATAISSTEYYVDTDPGYGKGTTAFTTQGTDGFLHFVLPLSSYPKGFHTLGLRSRDNAGRWSETMQYVFTINADKTPVNIVKLQYYFTGTGATDSVYTYTVATPAPSVDLNFTANLSQLPGNAEYDMHVVAISSEGSHSEEFVKHIKVCNGDPAKAKFAYVVSGKQVSFINNSLGLNNKYVWNFGDGKTDTLSNPLHDYDSADIYPVTLIASNVCNTDTTVDTVNIVGLKSIYTNVGGNTGSVTVDIRGAGFDSGMQVYLHKSGQQDIVGDTPFVQNSGLLTTVFDLTGKVAGLWDVVAKFPNGKADTLHNSFNVEAGGDPKLYVNITGDHVLRVGFNQIYTVTYGNSGNTDAILVPLLIGGLPAGTNIEILNPLFNVDSLSVFDTLDLVTDTINHTVIDTTTNTAFRVFYISNIPSNTSKTLQFVFHLPDTAALHTYPNIEVIIGSGIYNQLQSMQKSNAEDQSAKFDVTAFGECSASLFNFAASVALDLSGEHEWAECASGVAGIINGGLEEFVNRGRGKPQQPLDVLDVTYGVFETYKSCGTAILGTLFPETKLIKIVQNGIELAFKGRSVINSCTEAYNNIKEVDFNPIIGNAWDPNEKYGSGDSSSNHFIDSVPLSYVVNFENDKTANINAQTVTVTDTLSKSYYNYSSFGFTSVTIGNSVYLLSSPVQSFTHDFDFTSQYGVNARVTATFDTTTGVAQWKFLSIDPVTNQATTNALAGFLPPDVNSPEGQGYVSFTVRENSDLQTGDSIHNKATIVFDYNPPITTNSWKNVFDFVSPVSKVRSLPQKEADSVFTVQWSGSDNLSGVQGYDVYYAVNDGAFQVWKSDTLATQALFAGQPDSTYRFYTIARDNAGNVEAVKTGAEATTTVAGNGMTLTAKAFLQGPYVAAEGTMTDSLRAKKLVPLIEPYIGLGFTPAASTVGRTISNGLLDSTGAKAITDWVWVELRSAADAKQVVVSRSALIRRDGNIVDTDGVSPVYFNNVQAGNYYVAVRHRNHLGVMSSTPIAFAKGTPGIADFTKPTFIAYGTNAQQNSNGVMLMWAGDANGNALVTYNGASNDKNAILSIVGLSTSNNAVSGYFRADCSLDGKVSYNGAANDKNKVLSSVGLLTPNNTITEQLPK